jgi:hypothetical protein
MKFVKPCEEVIFKIQNFQIPNITTGCIKSAQNTQGATFVCGVGLKKALKCVAQTDRASAKLYA